MRALRRHRRLRAFDRYPANHWWRKVAAAQHINPDRAWNLARWLARDTNPGAAWPKAMDLLTQERDAMRRHSCPTCRALGAHSAGSDYLAWLETHVAWEDA